VVRANKSRNEIKDDSVNSILKAEEEKEKRASSTKPHITNRKE
jgi:hypothetical protein